jgi:hypothetical protein
MLLEQAQVGRNAVAGRQHDDVAGHQLAGIELLAWPPRRTVTGVATLRANAASAPSALASCQ